MPQINSRLEARLSSERLSAGWPWRLFLFSLLIAATAAVAYVGMEFGYKFYLQSQIQTKDQAIKDLTQSVSEDDQEKFVNFYSQLANLKVLLDEHITVSDIFPFLETNTNKQVYFNVLDFNFKDRRLSMEGFAQSYEILAQQLEAFNRAPEAEQLLVNESQTQGGSVKFRLSFVLKPEFFK